MPDPDQPSDACLVLLPHRDEQLVRLLSFARVSSASDIVATMGGIVELISF